MMHSHKAQNLIFSSMHLAKLGICSRFRVRPIDWFQAGRTSLRLYPLIPKNAFYEWLYIRALADDADWIAENVVYDAYTDIEFNPEKQVNCQARAFAGYKTLAARSQLADGCCRL